MKLIEVPKPSPGKVVLRVCVLGKRLRLGITPARARSLSLELQDAAEKAEAMVEPAGPQDGVWGVLERWLNGWRGDRG